RLVEEKNVLPLYSSLGWFYKLGRVVLGPTPTFSRHGRAQASLVLLIWLIEKVLQAIGTQNVS
ncbi:MAG: hypothetical protein SO096_04680, partial [Prevotella sp.]|nr:hypothetical protein [Prevotella sp.]